MDSQFQHTGQLHGGWELSGVGESLWALSSLSHYLLFPSDPSSPFLSQTCIDFSLPLYYHLICRILRFVTWELGTHTSNSVFHIFLHHM